MKKKCAICGKEFESKVVQQKYCSPECRKIAWNRQMTAIVKKSYYRKIYDTPEYQELFDNFSKDPKGAEELTLKTLAELKQNNERAKVFPEEFLAIIEKKTLQMLAAQKEKAKEIAELKKKLREKGVDIE